MEKYSSKIKKINKPLKPKGDTLFDNGYIKVVSFEDWSIVGEKNLVLCIPYLVETNEIIIREEYIPTFKYVNGKAYYATIICGGIEDGETPEEALLRELEEEAGIVLNAGYNIEFEKDLFLNKGNYAKIYPCILPLTRMDYTETYIRGDGSKVENKSKTFKLNAKFIHNIVVDDLVTAYMISLMKNYLRV